MSSPDAIKAALERNVRVIEARPSVGQGTAVTKVTLQPGLACEVEDGPWRFSVGMTEKYGGLNSGPNPGVYGRAAIGSCLAIGYGMWAARLDVPVRSLTVEVRARYDVRGELGISDDVPPGYTQVRYTVAVVSRATEADVRRVIDAAEKYSPYKDVFARANDLQRDLRIVQPTI
jgi:uncharacterized OsmC-like protein